jgi:hypothetical protein
MLTLAPKVEGQQIGSILRVDVPLKEGVEASTTTT